MKLTLLFAILFAAASLLSLNAQTAQPQATPLPLPHGALVKRADNISEWLVSITSGTDNPAKVPDANTQFASRTLVCKSGSMRDEVSNDAQGHRSEKWCEGSVQALLLPGSQEPQISTGGAGFSLGYTDYSKFDFPGVDFITRHNYIGTATVEGQLCYEFQDGIPNTTSSLATPPPANAAPTTLPNVGSTAFISVQTLWPVVVDISGVVTLIQMETPSFGGIINIPKNVQDEMDAKATQVKQLTTQAASP
jgi:hypothetical protein